MTITRSLYVYPPLFPTNYEPYIPNGTNIFADGKLHCEFSLYSDDQKSNINMGYQTANGLNFSYAACSQTPMHLYNT